MVPSRAGRLPHGVDRLRVVQLGGQLWPKCSSSTCGGHRVAGGSGPSGSLAGHAHGSSFCHMPTANGSRAFRGHMAPRDRIPFRSAADQPSEVRKCPQPGRIRVLLGEDRCRRTGVPAVARSVVRAPGAVRRYRRTVGARGRFALPAAPAHRSRRRPSADAPPPGPCWRTGGQGGAVPGRARPRPACPPLPRARAWARARRPRRPVRARPHRPHRPHRPCRRAGRRDPGAGSPESGPVPHPASGISCRI